MPLVWNNTGLVTNGVALVLVRDFGNGVKITNFNSKGI